MKELKSNKNGAINYATMKIYHVLEQQKKRLSEIVVPGSIGYLFFDREKFDKELMRKYIELLIAESIWIKYMMMC